MRKEELYQLGCQLGLKKEDSRRPPISERLGRQRRL